MISICNANDFMQYKYAMHAMHVLVLLISINERGGAFRAEQKKMQTASIRAYQIDGIHITIEVGTNDYQKTCFCVKSGSIALNYLIISTHPRLISDAALKRDK